MRVTYQSTMDERVRDCVRLRGMSGSTVKYLRNRIILVVVVAAAALFLLPTDSIQGAQFILLAGAFYIACAFALRRGRRVAICRQHLLRLSGGDGPVDTEVEVNEDGIAFLQGERRLALEWRQMAAIADRHDGIEITTTSPAVFSIPNRAVSGPGEREEWLNYLESHCSPGVARP